MSLRTNHTAIFGDGRGGPRGRLRALQGLGMPHSPVPICNFKLLAEDLSSFSFSLLVGYPTLYKFSYVLCSIPSSYHWKTIDIVKMKLNERVPNKCTSKVGARKLPTCTLIRQARCEPLVTRPGGYVKQQH